MKKPLTSNNMFIPASYMPLKNYSWARFGREDSLAGVIVGIVAFCLLAIAFRYRFGCFA